MARLSDKLSPQSKAPTLMDGKEWNENSQLRLKDAWGPALRSTNAWLPPSCRGGFLGLMSAESSSDEAPAPWNKG